MTKLSENIDKTEEQLSDEQLEKLAKRKMWIIRISLLAVFVVFCIGTIVFFSVKKQDDSVTKYVELGEYKGLRYTPHDLIVTDVDVSKEMDKLIESQTTYEDIEGTAGTIVQTGDVVNCSYVAKLEDKELEKGSGYFEIGSGFFPEFENALVGKVVNGTFNISVVIPENYADEKLKEVSGQKVSFEVVIKSKATKTPPELDDDFAYDVSNGEIETMAELDSYIHKKLSKEKEEVAKSNMESELIKEVIAKAKFKKIDKLVDEYYETMHKTYEDISVAYGLSYEDYIKKFYMTDTKSFEENLRSTMVDLVKEQLVLKAIAEKENIKVEKGSELYNKYMAEYLSEYKYDDAETFLANYGEDSVAESMLYDAVIDFVVENAVEK